MDQKMNNDFAGGGGGCHYLQASNLPSTGQFIHGGLVSSRQSILMRHYLCQNIFFCNF